MTKHRTPEEMREKIFNAFAELMAEMPYESVTTRAVAERAGVAYSALYTYFGSKDELLYAYCDQFSLLGSINFIDHLRRLPREQTKGATPERVAALIAEIVCNSSHSQADAIADLNFVSLALREPKALERCNHVNDIWMQRIADAARYCEVPEDSINVTVQLTMLIASGINYYRTFLGPDWDVSALLGYLSDSK